MSDMLRVIDFLCIGEIAPDWYHPDELFQELARRILALEARLEEVEGGEQFGSKGATFDG